MVQKSQGLGKAFNIPPYHGGRGLRDRFMAPAKIETFLQEISTYKSCPLSKGDLCVLYRIADGTLSPLEGPMDRMEFHSVLDEEVIERDGKKFAWTIPIALPVSKRVCEKFEIGQTIVLKHDGEAVAGTLEISDIYPFDKAKYNRLVYGTNRTDHPGPRIANDDPRDYLLGGKIWALPRLENPAYGRYMLSPQETRELFISRKWERIVAFQTRNPLHRAHEYAIVYALESLTKDGHFAGAVLNPLVGQTKSDDVPAEVRMRTYEALLSNKILGHGDTDEKLWRMKEYGLHDQLLLVGLDMKMFYAGPKEAVMHAIYRQNHGFTDIIIGRKHADAPFDDGAPVWGDLDAQAIFDNLKGELLIRPFKVGHAAYFEELGRVGLVEEYKAKGYKEVSISGKELRRKLEHKEPVDDRIMRKPVTEILYDAYKERQHNLA